jgi:hypothetical protein
MRVHPNNAIAGMSALLVSDCLRFLQSRISWNLAALETAASLEAGTGKSLLRALSAAGLVKCRARLVGDYLGGAAVVICHSGETDYAWLRRMLLGEEEYVPAAFPE